MKKLFHILASEIGPGPTPWRLEIAQRFASRLPFLSYSRLRRAIYVWGGVEVGAGTALMGHLRLWGSERLRIGAHGSFSGPISINLDAPVTIGDRVQIAHDVRIITVGHRIGPWTQRAGEPERRPVSIGDGCWIGANATLLPGTTLGAGSIVSAGAVVNGEVPPDHVASGNPASCMPLPRALRRKDGPKPDVSDPAG